MFMTLGQVSIYQNKTQNILRKKQIGWTSPKLKPSALKKQKLRR